MAIITGDEPSISYQPPDDLITGNEPVLTRRVTTRLGKRQLLFIDWLNTQTDPDVSMLECWRWVAKYTGNEGRGSSRRKRQRWNEYTSATLGGLLRSLKNRGLITIISTEPGISFVRCHYKPQPGESNEGNLVTSTVG